MTQHKCSSGKVLPKRDQVVCDVIQIVAEQMGMPTEAINEGSYLVEDLGCDSLDIVEICMEIEEQYDIRIPDEVVEKVRTIADASDGVLQLLAGTAGT